MDHEKTTKAVDTRRFVVPAEDAGARLDRLLAERIPELSRRRARVLVAAGSVWIDGRRVMVQSRPLAAGSEVVCHLQSFAAAPSEPLDAARILHEDASLLAIDKPPGMPSHPTLARRSGTALQLAEERLRRREGKKVPLWPLHRLDAGTSGILLFAKSRRAARAVSQNFARRRVRKRYLALVSGAPEASEGEIALDLAEGNLRTEVSPAGKAARTLYRVLEHGGGSTLLEVEPITGRMHQIRVHLAAIGHPVVGDAKYGSRETRAERLFLHASHLELPHPDGGWPLVLKSPPPCDFPRSSPLPLGRGRPRAG